MQDCISTDVSAAASYYNRSRSRVPLAVRRVLLLEKDATHCPLVELDTRSAVNTAKKSFADLAVALVGLDEAGILDPQLLAYSAFTVEGRMYRRWHNLMYCPISCTSITGCARYSV